MILKIKQVFFLVLISNYFATSGLHEKYLKEIKILSKTPLSVLGGSDNG